MNLLQRILTTEFDRRVARNPRFSMRAFSRIVGIPPSTLNNILAGRAGISGQRAEQIANALALDPEMKKTLLLTVASAMSRSEHQRKKASKQLARSTLSNQLKEPNVTLNQFKIVSGWQHFTILEFWSLENPPKTMRELAQRLGISNDLTIASFIRLIEAKMIVKTDEVSAHEPITAETLFLDYKPVTETSTTPTEVSNKAIKDHHLGMLDIAKTAVDNQDIKDRSIQSMTIAMDPQLLPLVKELITNFQNSVASTAHESKKKTKVYALTVQFFEAKYIKPEDNLL